MFLDSWTGKTIGMAVDQASELYGNREAFVFVDKRLSFHDLRTEANKVARAFLKLGLQPGDRVGIWMAGHSEWPSLFFGLAKAGLVFVPLNSRYKPNELDYAVRKSRIGALHRKLELALQVVPCPESKLKFTILTPAHLSLPAKWAKSAFGAGA